MPETGPAQLDQRCPQCQAAFVSQFRMLPEWWSPYWQNLNGYFGCEKQHDGFASALNTWLFSEVKQVHERDRYEWFKFKLFTRWLPTASHTIVIIFDAPPFVLQRLKDPLLHPQNLSSDPFWVHGQLVEEILRVQDTAVWAIRDHVREIESQEDIGRPEPKYRSLHDLARHAIHISETLEIATQNIDQILTQHTRIKDMVPDEEAWERIHSRLHFFQSAMASLRCRSDSNKERFNNEIQLAFNNVAQYHASISVDIGRDTKADSTAMRSIAFVTLVFLPPTFICAIFSMSFFQTSSSGDWGLSKRFWIYWAFAIPTTLLTSGLWYLRYQRQMSEYGAVKSMV